MTGLVDLSGVKLRERRSHRSGKSAFITAREYFTNNHIIIYLILIYNFSEFITHILFYIIISISPCHLLHKGMDSLRLIVDAKSGSPLTHLLFLTPGRPNPSIKNSIPVILSGVIKKFKNWRMLMGKLGQFHPSLKISQIKELPKRRFCSYGRLTAIHHYTTERE